MHLGLIIQFVFADQFIKLRGVQHLVERIGYQIEFIVIFNILQTYHKILLTENTPPFLFLFS